MVYQNLKDLPKEIKTRMFMDEHVDLVDDLATKFNISNEQIRQLLLLQNEFMLKKYPVSDFLKSVIESLRFESNVATKISVEWWGGYFLFFQDFLGKVDDLIVKNGGDLKKYQERVRQLLSPHRQLQDFIKSYIYDFHLENAGERARDELIDIIVDRALGKLTEQTLAARAQVFVSGMGVQTPAKDIANAIENLLAAGDISKNWAEYYVNLAENVLSGTPSHIEEKLKEQAVLPQKEGEQKIVLTTEEIQIRLSKMENEPVLGKKIEQAKVLLGAIDLHAMRKAGMYDKITHAEQLIQSAAQSSNPLEKKAFQDEIRYLTQQMVNDLKEAAEAPASAEEIQKALREMN